MGGASGASPLGPGGSPAQMIAASNKAKQHNCRIGSPFAAVHSRAATQGWLRRWYTTDPPHGHSSSLRRPSLSKPPTTHEVDGAVGFGLTTGAAGPLLWRDGDGDRRWRYLKKSDPVCPNQPS